MNLDYDIERVRRNRVSVTTRGEVLDMLRAYKDPTDSNLREQELFRMIKQIVEEHQAHREIPRSSCYAPCPRFARITNYEYYRKWVLGVPTFAAVSVWKGLLKYVGLLTFFVGGVLKIIRADQDGGVSFYATLIAILNNFLFFLFFVIDGEWGLALPKLLGVLTSFVILDGVIRNVPEDVDIWYTI